MLLMQEGGAAVYYILGLGLAGVACGLAQLAKPRDLELTAVAAALLVGTLAYGIVGSVTGISKAFGVTAGVKGAAQMVVLSQGIGESLACAAFALGLAIVQTITLSVAIARSTHAAPGSNPG